LTAFQRRYEPDNIKSAISFIIPDIVISEKTQSTRKNISFSSAEQIWNSLIEGNKRFVEGKPATHNIVSQRQSLETSQHPPVSVLSCSDSRVPPEIIFDQGLGDMFVVRVAGNSADPMGLGSLEYAVEHFATRVIVVLGHQRCGGVTAACSGKKVTSPNLKKLIQPIMESCSIAEEKHGSEDLIDFAIKTHVHKTSDDLLSRSEILKEAHDAGKLTIIGAYYSLDSGIVIRLR
jgi:carbonic anhydrase